MNIYIVNGSPLLQGNTSTLLAPVRETFEKAGHTVEEDFLYHLSLSGCLDCRACQKVSDRPGCAVKDDGIAALNKMIWADLILIASPLFTFGFTAPVKALLDRSFSMAKYYGDLPPHHLLAGKAMALVTTYGYPDEEALPLLEVPLQMMCQLAHMRYLGALVVRDINGLCDFTTPQADKKARLFAEAAMAQLSV